MRRQIEHPEYHRLQLQQLIGRGSYGQIYKAVSLPHNKLYAVKVIPSDSEAEALPKIEKQIRILMSTQHPNIVRCHSVEVVEDAVWIVMDYCEAGSLADVMSRKKSTFSERDIRQIMRQILEALAYLHGLKIMHRDIKAANILVGSDGNIKVADFGVSALLCHTQTGRHTKTGSPFWMSPQLLSKSQYSFKTDIWSLGITAIQLAEGAPPYSHQHPYRAIFSIQSHPPSSLSEPTQWSPLFNDFVKQCLTLDETHRPSAKELLEHPFLCAQSKNSLSDIPESDAEEREIETFQGGTMLIHDSKASSIWERQHCSKYEERDIGTVVINSYQSVKLQNEVIQKMALTEQLNRENSTEDWKNSGKSCIKQVQKLYEQMEAEIALIRKKYYKKIQQCEEKNNPTFQKSLKMRRSQTLRRK